MKTTHPLRSFVLGLVALTIGLVQCMDQTWFDATVESYLHPRSAFLAGKNTPVWLAYVKENNTMYYEKQQEGIVGRAVKYWKSRRNQGNCEQDVSPTVIPSIINDEENLVADKNVPSFEDHERHHIGKRDNNIKTLYPSILVLLEYKDPWPTNDTDQQMMIMNRILHALAFWNSVDLQLRHIPNPKIRLRVVGIVIARGGNLTTRGPRSYESGKRHDGELSRSVFFWSNIRNKPLTDFPHGAYDIVATLTDVFKLFHSFYGASTPAPPCDLSDRNKLNGLIVYDNSRFYGIKEAVIQMARILGHSSVPKNKCNLKHKYGRWHPCGLMQIKDVLATDGHCMESPKEVYPPGDPIKIILPGMLISASELCKALGWVDGNVCLTEAKCERLYCSNNQWYSQCSNAGAALDGFTCDQGKMCLDRKCVSNTTFLLHSE